MNKDIELIRRRPTCTFSSQNRETPKQTVTESKLINRRRKVISEYTIHQCLGFSLLCRMHALHELNSTSHRMGLQVVFRSVLQIARKRCSYKRSLVEVYVTRGQSKFYQVALSCYVHHLYYAAAWWPVSVRFVAAILPRLNCWCNFKTSIADRVRQSTAYIDNIRKALSKLWATLNQVHQMYPAG